MLELIATKILSILGRDRNKSSINLMITTAQISKPSLMARKKIEGSSVFPNISWRSKKKYSMWH